MEEAALQRDNRAIMAHVMLCAFVLFTALGVGIAFGLGFGVAVFGLCCGIYGYLLGQNEPLPEKSEK